MWRSSERIWRKSKIFNNRLQKMNKLNAIYIETLDNVRPLTESVIHKAKEYICFQDTRYQLQIRNNKHFQNRSHGKWRVVLLTKSTKWHDSIGRCFGLNFKMYDISYRILLSKHCQYKKWNNDQLPSFFSEFLHKI